MAETKETPPNDDGKEGATGTGNSNPPGDNQGGSTGTGGSGTTGQADDKDTIRQVVKEELAEALKGLKPAESSGTPATPRRADLEAEAERLVREATEKLNREQQHERDHEIIRNTKPAESAPAKVRRLTKALWGTDK